MANAVYPGYMGYADIASVGNVRFADASITATQTVEAPDLIMGDYDHDAYVYGKIEVGGSISGPVTETFAGGGSGIWDWATDRDECGDLTSSDVHIWYFCGGSNSNRNFTNLLVNNLNFSCAAGDIAQFSIDVMGTGAGAWAGGNPPPIQTAEKLITWDKVGVSVSPQGEWTGDTDLPFSNFDFTIANNLEMVYSLGQADLFPYDIVPGLRTITGSVSVFGTPQSNGFDNYDAYEANPIGTITFNIDTITVVASVRFHRVEPASSVGPIISTVGFTGVGHQNW